MAEDLGINSQTLYRWIKEHNEATENSEQSRVAQLEAELKASNKRVADLEETVTIIKRPLPSMGFGYQLHFCGGRMALPGSHQRPL